MGIVIVTALIVNGAHKKSRFGLSFWGGGLRSSCVHIALEMAAQMSAADRKKLKVQELRDELTLLGLDVSGTKAVLLERLEAALLSSDPAAEDEEKKEEEGIDKKTVVEDDLEDVPPEVEADLEKLDDDLVDEGTTKEIKELTEAERRKLRAEKFGTELSLEDKAKLRKERFGIKDPENEKKEVKEKPIVQSVLSEEERQKRLKRMERFGLERSGIEELKLQKDLQRKNKKM